ncbi:MAG TPA: hypothetical protein VJV41_16910 [Mycobacterium sp.]|nr:hypothetical protein [Mycobacterium sp.]HKP42642.1 hypothetical protein [Mycobacterium sp.]
MSLDQRQLNRAEQVEHLRRKMAAVSSKVGGGRRGQAPSADVLTDSESLLPIPESQSELLPASLPRGTVAVVSGARSLSLSMVAAVTAEGGHAAIVGQPDVGLLAAVEMGADLSRIALIPEPGADPVEVAAVLMDGMDLVVLGLGGRSVPATRARAVVARARQKGCTLLVTGGDWQGASTRLEARVCGYEITGPGHPGIGRISKVRLAMRGRGRSFGTGAARPATSGPVRAVGG